MSEQTVPRHNLTTQGDITTTVTSSLGQHKQREDTTVHG